ncbi:MAG TPA: helix-turn-helix domain-containing protein [Pyrinomonadaceae bacterium]|jgi:AraC-like DNA-binding protein
MDSAQMFYRELTPAPEFSHLVLSFWEFTRAISADAAPVKHEIFPDGCISLFYYRNASFGMEKLALNCLHLQTIEVPIFPGDVYWGMRFSPAACARILRCEPQEIPAQILGHEINFGFEIEKLTYQLVNCQEFEAAAAIFQNHLSTFGLSPENVDIKILEALSIIEENKGEIKIAEIAERIGLSPRQFERRFKASAGVTPKQFVRTRRFRATAVALLEENSTNWANRAAEMGFADQAHLSHEFSALAGRTPNSFARHVKKIEHGSLIK